MTTETRTPVRNDDSGLGLGLFATLTAACLIVTGAVAMLSLIDAWWVLGFAFGVHLLMTAAVALAVFSALSGGAFWDRGRCGSSGRAGRRSRASAPDADRAAPGAPDRSVREQLGDADRRTTGRHRAERLGSCPTRAARRHGQASRARRTTQLAARPAARHFVLGPVQEPDDDEDIERVRRSLDLVTYVTDTPGVSGASPGWCRCDSRFGAVPRARRRPGRVGAGGPHVGRPARNPLSTSGTSGRRRPGRGARLNRGGATAAAVPDGRRGARSATPPASGSRGLAAGCSASSRLAMRAALAKPTRALSTVSSAPTLRCRNRSSRRPTDARAPRLSRAGPPPRGALAACTTEGRRDSRR